MGETAPLIMTALGSTFINLDVTKPTSAVPLLIWEFYNDPNMVSLVWSSSLFLMALVLALNIISRRMAVYQKNGKKR
jgi:phosphate transport system permease protein